MTIDASTIIYSLLIVAYIFAIAFVCVSREKKNFGRGALPRELAEAMYYFLAKDYQKAIIAGEKAAKLYPQDVRVYFLLGQAYKMIGEFDLALLNFKKAELYTKSKVDLAYLYREIGNTYLEKRSYDDALYYYNKALNIALDAHDIKLLASLYRLCGIVYEEGIGNSDKALECLQKSLDFASEELDKALVYMAFMGIYNRKGDYNKAIEWGEKAFEIFEKYGDHYQSAIVLLSLGESCRKAGKYDKAIHYLEEALKKVNIIGDQYLEATVYKHLGLCYKDLNNNEIAREYTVKAYKLFEAIGAEGEAFDILNSEIGKKFLRISDLIN